MTAWMNIWGAAGKKKQHSFTLMLIHNHRLYNVYILRKKLPTHSHTPAHLCLHARRGENYGRSKMPQ